MQTLAAPRIRAALIAGLIAALAGLGITAAAHHTPPPSKPTATTHFHN